MSRSHTRRGHADTPRNEHGEFISHTEHLINGLTARFNEVRDQRQRINQEVRTTTAKRNAVVQGFVFRLLPNLSVQTISQLKAKCPGFVIPARQEAINAAHNPPIGFSNDVQGRTVGWLSALLDPVAGGATRHRGAILQYELENQRRFLQVWLSQNVSALGFMSDEARLDHDLQALREKAGNLESEEGGLSAQIGRLNQVYERYSAPNAPKPPQDLHDAVIQSADRVRAAPQSGSTPAYYDSGDYYRDVMIRDILFDSAMRRSEDRHSRDYYDHQRQPLPADTDWTPSRGTTRTADDYDQTYRGGSASGKMSEAADAEDGNASGAMAEAAPAEEGNASGSMGDPVIAEEEKVSENTDTPVAEEPSQDEPEETPVSMDATDTTEPDTTPDTTTTSDGTS